MMLSQHTPHDDSDTVDTYIINKHMNFEINRAWQQHSIYGSEMEQDPVSSDGNEGRGDARVETNHANHVQGRYDKLHGENGKTWVLSR